MRKVPLLMLPGWGMGPWVWQPVRFELAQRFELILMDWAGVEQVEDFEIRVLERIGAEHWDEFAFLGWSLGSLVALKLASQLPERIRQLILCGATACFTADKATQYAAGWPRQVLERMKRNLKQDRQATLDAFYAAQFSEVETKAGHLSSFLERVVHDEINAKAEELALGLDYLIQADYRGVLAGVAVPTLLLHGSHDSICPVAAAAFIATHLAGKSRLHIMEGMGHLPFWSRPDETLRMIDQYNCELER